MLRRPAMLLARLSMIRISILRLKRSMFYNSSEIGCNAINDKNLNSEIETNHAVTLPLPFSTSINDKNLNSEIETRIK